MKKIGYLYIFLLFIFTSCADHFIDLDPVDSITEAAYYTKPEHFKATANGFYNKMISWRSINNSNIFDFMDFGSDLNSYSTDYGRGTITIPSNDIYWDNSYAYIRENNILLKKAKEYSGNQEDIAEYVAAAKFFRAWHHFFLLERFGGVPIVTTVLDLDSDELLGARKSRYEVIAQILKDLDDAIKDLPLEQNIPSDAKGHLSSYAAKAFKARVLLFEATYEKNVGTTTDGDGISEGAGTTKPDNYPTTDKMLEEAVSLAYDIMTNGGYKLWNHNSELNNLSSCYLFNLDDAESNPAGLTKSSNNEFILYNVYDYDLYKGNKNISHTVGYRLVPSRKFMDMFLCTDGLPISQSGLFQGYKGTSDEYKNRDYRLTSYFCDLGTWNTPENGSVILNGPGGGSGSGYSCRKFYCYNYGTYRAAKEESYNYPQIRLPEVYLIYAEALYDLNGSLTDGQLDASINKIKARAGLPALTNSFASDNGLNILEEIKRERAIELFGENNRFLDLKRWGIAEKELNANICGSVIEGTDYENNSDLYSANSYPYGETIVETGIGKRRVLLLDPASNRNFKRMHYLFPLPQDQLQLNSRLIQNPGYK